jgi:hypothetical protein
MWFTATTTASTALIAIAILPIALSQGASTSSGNSTGRTTTFGSTSLSVKPTGSLSQSTTAHANSTISVSTSFSSGPPSAKPTSSLSTFFGNSSTFHSASSSVQPPSSLSQSTTAPATSTSLLPQSSITDTSSAPEPSESGTLFEYHDNEVKMPLTASGYTIITATFTVTGLSITPGQDPDGKNTVGMKETYTGNSGSMTFTVGRSGSSASAAWWST